MKTIGEIYEVLQKIEELKNLRTSLLSPIYMTAMFLDKDMIEYMQKNNNIPITETSSDNHKEIHSRVDKINKQLEELMKIEF